MTAFIIPKDAYLRENRKTRPAHVRREKSLPKAKYIYCPRRCTQARTINYRLKERKTYNLRTNRCEHCGFSYTGRKPVTFTKASKL